MIIEIGTIVGIVFLLFVVATIVAGVKIVSQTEKVVVERLGKYLTTLSGGLNFIIPYIDKPINYISTKERILNIPRQPVITKDNVNIHVDGIVFCVVINAEDATYKVSDFENAIMNLALTSIRSEIGQLNLDETLSSRENMNTSLLRVLDTAANNWGVKIMRVEISEISVPVEIENAMNMQMKAEREKRAIELKAIAEKESKIREAEAVKQTAILQAEAIERMAEAKKYEIEQIAIAEKKSISLINESLEKNQHAGEYLLAKGRIEAFKTLAESDSNKILIPYEATQLIGNLAMIGEFLGKKQ